MSYSRTYRNSRDMMYHGDQKNLEGQAGSGNEEGPSQQSHTSRHEWRNGYTVFRPDEKKRAHLQEVAKRETEEASARSESRRLMKISERPQSVGGAMGRNTAILQKQREMTMEKSSLEMKKKREQWQAEKREKEEKEIEQKRAKARAQAERNKILEAVRAQERTDRQREEHRRKNNAFLDRLEYGY